MLLRFTKKTSFFWSWDYIAHTRIKRSHLTQIHFCLNLDIRHYSSRFTDMKNCDIMFDYKREGR